MAHQPDRSHGWDAIAEDFMRLRSDAGVSTVRNWAHGLGEGTTVLDIGCGHGLPLTPVLVSAGLSVSAIDASPKMVAAYRQAFPAIPIACEPVEDSRFFDKKFDAILAIGLIFLLPEHAQRQFIDQVAKHLNPKGWFLFSAPRQICEWKDLQTGRASSSLGIEAYRACLAESGLAVIATDEDEGGSFYVSARKI
ncbi:class I SAM-dependent methyltransferase [Litorimonas sp. WD9-15]|uniref:class I SAM-dependent methyltransferase n=1 Tax=Litorimonas sp. WD9-15 TaxID=3418716 RepID=UPI003CFF37DD